MREPSDLRRIMDGIRAVADGGPIPKRVLEDVFGIAIGNRLMFFDRLAKEARSRGVEGVRKILREENTFWAPMGSDSTGTGGEEWWLQSFWALLYPEMLDWIPYEESDSHGVFRVFKGEKMFGERERQIIYGMITSVSGLAFLFDLERKEWLKRLEVEVPWSDETTKNVEILLGNLYLCASPGCGDLFVKNRKGQRFCSDVCRKRAHTVPSSKRKDPTTARIYFYRKICEGYSREKAWEMTMAKHGETLKKLGLDSPKSPASWAKPKGE